MHIRAVQQQDFEAWSALWLGYLTFYSAQRDADQYQRAFDWLLSQDPSTFSGFVAEHEGALIGLVHYVFHPHMWEAGNVCYLQDLYVSQAARGTGAGRALIEAVYAAAEEHGAPRVYWTTQEDNHVARALYDRIARKTDFIKYERVL